MLLWINLVLMAVTGLRCASRAINVCATAFNLDVIAPSWHTGRLWFMRLGYYKFNRPKQKTDDWAWILDHTVQIGKDKCLLILGIRLSMAPKDRPLTFGDLEPIDLIPMRQSNGEIIYALLEQTVAKTGVPRQLIADHGPDINAGINMFIKVHPDTCSTWDIKHKTASILKQLLGDDKAWTVFIKECATTRKQVQQTELAGLAPPNQRTKARYMNVDILIVWGMRILQLFTSLMNMSNWYGANISINTTLEEQNIAPLNSNNTTVEIDMDRLQDKLGWIVKYSVKLNELNRIMIIIATIESFIRAYGYTTNTVFKLQQELKDCTLCERSKKVKDLLLEFVRIESAKVRLGETLLGSSEIIESLFGKQKILSNEQSKSGFTGLIVGIGAFVGDTTKEVIMAAMETVKTKDVKQWVTKTIGRTVQSVRNLLCNNHQKAECGSLKKNNLTDLQPEQQIIFNESDKDSTDYLFAVPNLNEMEVKWN